MSTDGEMAAAASGSSKGVGTGTSCAPWQGEDGKAGRGSEIGVGGVCTTVLAFEGTKRRYTGQTL